jgi:hypothetical protein
MTGSTTSAQLDAHDALVRACLDGTLPLLEFAAAYGNFPGDLAGMPTSQTPHISPTLQRRLAFHSQVAGVLAGAPDLDGWLAGAILMRLGHLATRYPDFTYGG